MFGLISMQILLLVWSLGGTALSAWSMYDCKFLLVNPSTLPPPQYDTLDDNLNYQYTGYIGFLTIEQQTTQTFPGNVGGTTTATTTQCVRMTATVSDELYNRHGVAGLLGLVALATGGVASIVLLASFLLECCCKISGMQFGLGVMYLVAAATQGLTFLGIKGWQCENELDCRLAPTSTWTILAICLFFIAMVHAFVVPFPQDRVCGAACCPCCCRDGKEEEDDDGKEDAEEGEEENDEEAQIFEEEQELDDGDAAKAAAVGAVAGVAAGAGGAAVVAAANANDDDADGEDNFVDEEDADGVNAGAAAATGAVAGAAVAGAVVAGAAADEDEEEEEVLEEGADEVKKSASEEAAALSENCTSRILDCISPTNGEEKLGESISPIEPTASDADESRF